MSSLRHRQTKVSFRYTNKATLFLETCDLLKADRIKEILGTLGGPETGGGVRGARAHGRLFPRDHLWSQRLRPTRCECRWGGSAPKPLLFCRRITASFVCLLSCSRGAAGAGMGSLGPAESSCTSMPSPRQDDFMAARVQSGAPPTAAISAMAPSQAPVCRVHEMKLSTWLECLSACRTPPS